MKSNFKRRIILFLVGAVILTFGVALTIQSNYGAGAWDSVNVGLSKIFGLSVGKCSIIVSVILTFVAGVIRNWSFKPMTMVTATILGIFIDGWLYIIRNIIKTPNDVIRIVLMICGIIILSIGLGIYLYADLYPNPLDDCMMAVREKVKLSIGISKVIIDGLGILISVGLKSPIGIGTLLSVIGVGLIANYVYKLLDFYLE